MTHFNHEWDTTKTPAVPVSVGDRFYAQDLNDDFNYLKHLPYEAILQGRTKGVMIPPTDTWNADSHSLTLSGGFGVVALNIPVLDTNKDFTIPPKTTSVSRYERVAFSNVTLILPNDGNAHYIVATPTKRSLLQRGKALFSENYACRVKYDSVITIQDTAPSTNQILIGLCHDNEYLLCKDFVFNQGVDTIKLHKWYGENKITDSLVPLLKSYYNTGIYNIETHISIDTVSGYSIRNGIFSNCTITIGTVSGYGINSGDFSNCTITIDTINSGNGINNGTFSNCTITIDTINNGNGIDNGIFSNCTIHIESISGGSNRGISGGTFNSCTITIGAVNGGNGIYNGIFNNCTITIDTIDRGYGIYSGTFKNCTISIDTIDNIGIYSGTFSNCTITIGTVSGNGAYSGDFRNCTISIDTINSGYGINNGIFSNCTITIDTTSRSGINRGTFNSCTITIDTASSNGISNSDDVVLYLTRIECASISNLSDTTGKLNILNGTIFHAN